MRRPSERRPKPVLINSPNNPTGVVYDQASLEKLGELLKKKSQVGKLYIHTDEAYRRIVFDQIQLPNAFRYYPHTIRVTSHSKDLSLAGERIGYIAVNPLCEGVDELIFGNGLCQPNSRFRQRPGIDAVRRSVGLPSKRIR